MENQSAGSIAAIVAGLSIFFILIFALMIYTYVCRWKIFTKSGQEGWKALIPIYNTLILLDIIKKPRWQIFLYLLFPVSFVILIIHFNELSKAFGKDSAFTVGLILLSPIFFGILAFGDAKYIFAEEDSLINEIQEFK
jgi:hypothetical protein